MEHDRPGKFANDVNLDDDPPGPGADREADSPHWLWGLARATGPGRIWNHFQAETVPAGVEVRRAPYLRREDADVFLGPAAMAQALVMLAATGEPAKEKVVGNEVANTGRPSPSGPSPATHQGEVVAVKVIQFAKRWGYSKRQIETYIRRGLPLVNSGHARRVPLKEGDEWMRTGGEDPAVRRARKAARRQAPPSKGSGR